MSNHNPSHNARDDFRKIKGIGEVTEKALNNLGILTYQDLAQRTPAGLADLLKGKISELTLHRIRKEDWPSQAKALMVGMVSKPGEPQSPAQPRETWRELADFFISFGYSIDDHGEAHIQTKVHHSQADKMRQWDGIATDQLVSWMLKQADLPAPKQSLPDPENQLIPTEGEQVIRMTLADVWVNEVPNPENPIAGPLEGFLRVETELTLLDDLPLDKPIEHAPYSVEFYLIDTQTNQSRLVDAYSDYLSPSARTYPITQDIAIPEAGRYQLILFARLLPPLIGITQAQGPLIRVEV